jgi:prolyl oligopeptidase
MLDRCRPLFRPLRRALVVIALTTGLRGAAESADPYQWLEDIEGAKALDWVREQNRRTAERLTTRPEYDALYREALAALNSASRLPAIEANGDYLYNLWQDAAHPRGLFRRTTPAEFRKAEPAWETVLDVDALARTEGRPWAWAEPIWCRDDPGRCLLQLSPGGGDAAELREFDLNRLAFVPNGFAVPTAKSRAAWLDRDTLLVGTDFGAGSLTDSGYPRLVKRWRRGTPLAAATVVHEAPASSVWALGRHLGTGAEAVNLVSEALTFWTARFLQVEGDRAIPLAIPASATVVDGFGGRLVLWLKDDWALPQGTFAAGSLVLADVSRLRGGAENIDELLAPTPTVVVQGVWVVKDALLVSTMDNVRGRLQRIKPAGRGWSHESIPFPDNGALTVATTREETGESWVEYQSFTIPPTLYHVPAGSVQPIKVKAEAPTFDGARFEARQFWCTSEDGTQIPYFVVGPKTLPADGRNPVWMFSYGGFENSLTPAYSGSYEDLHGAYGKLWLERGGIFVLANIRGGGEFGPAWHHATLKENHHRAFEDFEAVARDLVARKLTSPAHLGIEGRSNGGLLVAATMLRHPELYGAVVCGSPLLDMGRYHKLLAGASWVAEYGDPDRPEEWDYIRRYSPYQNVRLGMKLPPVMFYTSTRDDRVHPGHARKMAAKMEALGYEVEYYENIEGGHHGSVTSEQLATRLARTYTFLWEKVGKRMQNEE